MENNRAPDRIFNWEHTQLSIARHYGGCTFNGTEYVVAYDEDGHPLVRRDVKFPKATRPKRNRKKDGAP